MHRTQYRTLRLSEATWLTLALFLGLASCTREPERAEHSVSEYRANADLRRETFARCTNDPGALGKTPDCVNAREAERLESIGSVRDSPTIKLPRPGEKH
jgi:hypothetical protein